VALTKMQIINFFGLFPRSD